MNGGKNTTSLWKRRAELPFLPLPGAAFAGAILCGIGALGVQCGVFALVFAVLCATVLAALLLLCRSPFVLAVPLVGTAVILLSSGGGIAVFLSLLFLPMGWAVAAAVYRGMSRMAASVLTAAVTGISGVLLFGASLLLGGIPLREGMELARERILSWLLSLSLPVAGGERLPVFSPEAGEALLRALTPLLPGLVGGGLFLIGCSVTVLLRRILRVLGAGEDFFAHGWRLRANRSCAVLYCGAQLTVLLGATTPNAMLLYYIAYNIAVVFMLPLAAVGIAHLVRRFRSPDLGGMTRAAILCLAVMLTAGGIYWLLSAAALYGVYIEFHRAADGV